MLKHVSRPSTLGLLELLVPSLVCRARAFSQPALKPGPPRKVQDVPLLHSKIRDQIMGQTHSRRMLPESVKDTFNKHLAEIGRAIRGHDLTTALLHWRSLEEHRESLLDGEACRLPEVTLKELHRLFTMQYQSIMAHERWSDDLKTLAEDFAMQAAKHHSAEALFTIMLHHIERKDPQAVLILYEKCSQIIVNDTTQPVEPVANEEGLALSEAEGSDPYFDPHRVSVLLAVIAAHAMNDSFKAALDAYVASGLRIRSFRKESFYKLLQNNPALRNKVEKYVDRLAIASLVSRPPSLSKHIVNLSHPRSAALLKKLYRDILNGLSGPDAYLAVDQSAVSDTKLAAMTEYGWTSFQTGFIKSERIDLAAHMWDDLAQLGITPGVTMWTGLLDTYADLRDSKQAKETWNMMLQQGIEPDDLSYRAIIAVLFDDDKAAEALARFKEYQVTTTGRSERVYNTVLRGLLRINLIDDANALLADMHKNGPRPDIISYNTFLAFYGRQKNFKGLANVTAQMSAENITGDVVTYSTILSALLQAGRKDAPATILSLMRKQGIKPSVATYTAIIDHQMREQTESNLRAALGILDKMEQEGGVKPNEVTYTSILSGLHRGQWLSRERADEVRKEIVARMRRERLAFRLPTYHILIRAALDSPDPRGHLDALGLIQEMENQDIPRVNTTWYLLFAGLMSRGQWDAAKEMVRKMYHTGHQPNAGLTKLVNDIKRHRG